MRILKPKLKRNIAKALLGTIICTLPSFCSYAAGNSMGDVDRNYVGQWQSTRGSGVTYATVGATVHKIDIDPATGGGSDDPDVDEKPPADTSGNPYIGNAMFYGGAMAGDGETSGHSLQWLNKYQSKHVEPAETHRTVGDFIYATWNWLGSGGGVQSVDKAQIIWDVNNQKIEKEKWGTDMMNHKALDKDGNLSDQVPYAYEINGILVQDDKGGRGMLGGFDQNPYTGNISWLLGTGYTGLEDNFAVKLPDDEKATLCPSWGWGAVYTYQGGYLRGMKHNDSNSLDDYQGAILYNVDPGKYPNVDLGRGGSGQDSKDPSSLISYYTNGTTQNEIKSRYGVLYLQMMSPIEKDGGGGGEGSSDPNRYWELGKSTPEGYTWNIGDKLNGSTPEFDVGIGIPATEDIRNGFVANSWYGKVKGYERGMQTKAYTIRYQCPAYYETTHTDKDGNTYTITHNYTRYINVDTSRSASYQAIYNADLRELNNVTVDNGAYGDEGPIKYGPDDCNYNSVSVELLINGKKTETPSTYSESYTVKDDDHIDWPSEPGVQVMPEIETDDREGADYFLSYWDLQNKADTTELLTVTTYSDKLVVNGKTYLAGGSSTTHDAHVAAEGPKEESIVNASVTSNTGSGGHYLQRNNEKVITIPSDVKNGTYPTTLTLTYARMVPRDGNTKDTILNGVSAILNETKNGDSLKSNEPVIVDTPVISPIKIIDPETGTQLVNAPNAHAYKLLLDGTYTLEFQPEIWESEDRTSNAGDSTLDGYENDENTADRYDKYVAHKRVRFPFPVEAADMNDGDAVKYWPVTSTGFTDWIEIPKYSNILKFYVPTWVTETNTLDMTNQRVYTAEFRVESISSDGLDDDTEESDINTELENHVSTYTIDMIVAGSIYDFKIIGTSDKDMFSGYTEDVNEDQNYAFVPNYEEKRVGTKNRLGKDYIRYAYDGSVTTSWSSTNTLPLRNGTSNKYSNMGSLWKGTTFSFSFKTIANLADQNDSIIIKPRFKYVVMTNDSAGNQINKTYTNDELAMFYSDEKGNYIRVGSSEDKTTHQRYVQLKNPQFRGSWYMGGTVESWFTTIERDIIKNRLGSTYLDLMPDDISYTTGKLGKTNIEFQNAKNYSYSMSEIKLDKNLRMLTGDREQLARNQSAVRTDTNFDNITNMVGTTSDKVTENTFRDSMQTWYGQYTIPQKFYITTVDKLNSVGGLQNYAKNGKLSEDSDLWLQDGYLIIGFDITTKNGGNDHLAYKAPSGVDMWDSTHENQIEKIKLPPQTKPLTNGDVPDSTEREIPIEHGDVVVVDLRYKQSDKLSARTFMIN